MKKKKTLAGLILLLTGLLLTLGGGWALALPQTELPKDLVPSRAIILRDGGTILVDLEPAGTLRYDQRYGSPTRGEFFYQPPDAPERSLGQSELKKAQASLSKKKVKFGKEYYDSFLAALEKKIRAQKAKKS